jgi:hypothetical protein
MTINIDHYIVLNQTPIPNIYFFAFKCNRLLQSLSGCGTPIIMKYYPPMSWPMKFMYTVLLKFPLTSPTTW